MAHSCHNYTSKTLMIRTGSMSAKAPQQKTQEAFLVQKNKFLICGRKTRQLHSCSFHCLCQALYYPAAQQWRASPKDYETWHHRAWNTLKLHFPFRKSMPGWFIHPQLLRTFFQSNQRSRTVYFQCVCSNQTSFPCIYKHTSISDQHTETHIFFAPWQIVNKLKNNLYWMLSVSAMQRLWLCYCNWELLMFPICITTTISKKDLFITSRGLSAIPSVLSSLLQLQAPYKPVICNG